MATLPAFSFGQHRLAQIAGIPSETYLEDQIVAALSDRAQGRRNAVHRQRRFPSEHILHDHDRPDFIIESDSHAIVCELKLYRATTPDWIQLWRYMQNPYIKNSFHAREFRGVLIAQGFDDEIRAKAAQMPDCSLYAYTEKSVFPLRVVGGADVLAPYFKVLNAR